MPLFSLPARQPRSNRRPAPRPRAGFQALREPAAHRTKAGLGFGGQKPRGGERPGLPRTCSGRPWFWFALLLACVLTTGQVWADQADQARFYDASAREHFQKGNYRAALDDFFAAQALTPSPTLAFNIATCFRQLGQPRDAYTYFTEALEIPGLGDDFRKAAESAKNELRPRVARIHVVSEPPGALVFVDDENHGDYGKTPREIAIDPGKHRVWVVAPGYEPAAQTVEVALGGVAELALSPRQITGLLHVSGATPEGLRTAPQVRVLSQEGQLVAQGPFPFEKALPPDSYRVHVEAPELQPWSRSAVVTAGQSLRLDADLLERPKPTGDISAVSTVPGSIVELDGVEMGTAPLVIPNVTVGEHKLVIKGPGGPPVSAQVPVVEQRRTWATADYGLKRTVAPVTYWVAGAGLLALGVGTGLLAASYNMYDSGDLSGKDYQTAAISTLIGGAVTLAVSGVLYLSTGRKVPVNGQLTLGSPE